MWRSSNELFKFSLSFLLTTEGAARCGGEGGGGRVQHYLVPDLWSRVEAADSPAALMLDRMAVVVVGRAVGGPVERGLQTPAHQLWKV